MIIKKFKIGQKKEIRKKITKRDIIKFANLTGDQNPIHTNIKYAKKSNIKKNIAHGMLSASFISNIIGNKIPGPGALWMSQNLEFLNPVYVNDTIRVLVEIISIDERFNLLNLKTEVHNQDNLKVISGLGKVKILAKEKKFIKKVANKETKLSKKTKNLKRDTSKVALIVGSTGSIGSEVFKNLPKKNFKFVLHYFKNLKKINGMIKYSNSKNIYKISCDISKSDEVVNMYKKIKKKFGRLDLVVNASTEEIYPKKFENLVWKDFDSQIKSQLKGNFNIVNESVKIMQDYGGKIIVINSAATDLPMKDFYHYTSSKGALTSFIKSIAGELANKGIQINSVSPSMIDNRQMEKVSSKAKMITIAKTPIKRLCLPEDVANAVVYLASNKASFLCGETIRINGGQIII